MTKKHHAQMSESIPMALLLALAGGFLDSYSFIGRGEVFANAQTGNMVLFGANLINRNFKQSIKYLIPIIAFAVGVFIVEEIRRRFKEFDKIHWRQIILVIEIVLLFFVAFIPQSRNIVANLIISFVCSLQVESFRKVKSNAFATTMCTGNLRSGTSLLVSYFYTKNPELKKKSKNYFIVIIIFILGAAFAGGMVPIMKEKAIFIPCIILTIAFVMMFIKEDIEKVE